MTYIIALEKKNARGKRMLWKAEITDNTVVVVWGQESGKMQEKKETFLKGKNIGRANETTPAQQCLLDVVVKARKKVDSGYVVTEGKEVIEANSSKTFVKADTTIPKPMLANKYKDHLNKMKLLDEFYVQPKLDGNRCLVNTRTGKMYSRSRKEIISAPHVGAEVLEYFKDSEIEWLDGELYSHKMAFNEMQSFIRKSKPETIDFEKAKAMELHVFDYISEEPYCVRGQKLESIFGDIEPKYLSVVKHEIINAEDLRAKHDEYVSDGYEGIMIRFKDFPYESKRSLGLFKYKVFFDAEYKIVGFNPQENNIDRLGTIQVSNGEISFPVSPAFTNKEKDYMYHNQDEFIGKMATVIYQELEETGVPRFGVVKHIRAENDLGE